MKNIILIILVLTLVLSFGCVEVDKCKQQFEDCKYGCGDGIASGICKEGCTWDYNDCKKNQN